MARLRIDPSFERHLDDYPSLRSRAVSALQRFVAAPARRGANFEPLEGSDGRYWSLRVNRNFRIILRRERDAEGDIYAAIDLGPHDIYRRYSGRR
jgi:plasmid maintenance system killer protein